MTALKAWLISVLSLTIHNPRNSAMKSQEFFIFLVSRVRERPWWPIQSPNRGRRTRED